MFKALMICAVLGFAAAVSPVHPVPIHPVPVHPVHPVHPVPVHPVPVHPVHPAPHPHPAPAHHAVVGRAEDVHAEVTSRKDDVRADGFDTGFETSNHIQQAASGDVHGNIHGSFGWISPEGQHVTISYVANEHGYQPTGDAVPAIPEAIVRSLAWNEAHPHGAEPHHNPHPHPIGHTVHH
ncbi:maker25 [Drosophila busckii]|uniref:Maker25 n=1 Tax=Drosophila busckii TaxID=30019 RepID=A0A0M4ETQ0_DROBS|nr:larval cuticle protein 1 [Drosophila busckii]ALC40925.1 maker25 [Drosophila busckii]